MVVMVAEGYKDGKVVCTDQRMPSRRSTKLRLYVDEMGKPLVADGSDFVVVVAEVTDDNGHVRRLAKENIRFTLEGEGEIIGDASINANPRAVEWGSAPILVRSTMKPGKIKIHAEVQFLVLMLLPCRPGDRERSLSGNHDDGYKDCQVCHFIICSECFFCHFFFFFS